MKCLIATWPMSLNGVRASVGLDARAGLLRCIETAESDPSFPTVGFGGLTDSAGETSLDAAFMDGDTLKLGAVGALRHIEHPIAVAEALSHEDSSNFLVGQGAFDYARQHCFPYYTPAHSGGASSPVNPSSVPHDTIGVISLSHNGSMYAGTSTNGLFNKHPDRIGDSPFPGCGYYVDSQIGGAAATGMGEDIMRCVLSYDVVSRMERGASPLDACQQSLQHYVRRMSHARSAALIALNKYGQFGAAAIGESFSAVCYTKTAGIFLLKVDPVNEGGDLHMERLNS